MLNPDHQPYVDEDGWLIPGANMLSKNDRVSISSDIECDTGITREYAEALSGQKGVVIEEKKISYHSLTDSSVLVQFDTPFPNPDGSEMVVESFWVPRKYVFQYQESI